MDQQGSYIIYNGTLYPSDAKIIGVNSRIFRYGDGLFETMRVKDKMILLAELHFRRLAAGMELLHFNISDLTEEHFHSQVLSLLQKNGHENFARVRLQVFKDAGNLFEEDYSEVNYIIQSFPLPSHYELFDKKTTIGIFQQARKSCDNFSNVKSCNYLPYVLGAMHAKRYGWDDALILNSAGRIAESAIANIFWIFNGRIYTPPLTEGCVAGVMRENLIGNSYLRIVEKELDEQQLLEADEVFLTNAVNGLRSIDVFGRRNYQRKTGTEIFHNYIANIRG